MQIEIAVTDARAKRRVQKVLRDLGHRAESGPVRLAAPFTVVVGAAGAHDVTAIWSVVLSVDPGAIRREPVPVAA